MVASNEPQVFDLETLSARMAQPKVREDLARIHLQLPTTLLGRQVHADEAQKKFGGEGVVNTDDHNILEYNSPIAYFVSADVRVPDSRRLAEERGSLELTKVLNGRALSIEEARDLYASLSWVHPPDDPLVRSAAAAWFEADRESIEPAQAFAAASLRQGDVLRAREVLKPFIDRDTESPDALATWLEATRRLATREGAPWHTAQADVADAEARARRALSTHPKHERLTELLAVTK
jgi:hypothetical protein